MPSLLGIIDAIPTGYSNIELPGGGDRFILVAVSQHSITQPEADTGIPITVSFNYDVHLTYDDADTKDAWLFRIFWDVIPVASGATHVTVETFVNQTAHRIEISPQPNPPEHLYLCVFSGKLVNVPKALGYIFTPDPGYGTLGYGQTESLTEYQNDFWAIDNLGLHHEASTSVFAASASFPTSFTVKSTADIGFFDGTVPENDPIDNDTWATILGKFNGFVLLANPEDISVTDIYTNVPMPVPATLDDGFLVNITMYDTLSLLEQNFDLYWTSFSSMRPFYRTGLVENIRHARVPDGLGESAGIQMWAVGGGLGIWERHGDQWICVSIQPRVASQWVDPSGLHMMQGGTWIDVGCTPGDVHS
jgi:hypothetical protein